MKKSELIKKLDEIEGDPEVIMSIDPEGNGFNPVADVNYSTLDADGDPLHPDDVDEYAPENPKKAIVIWA